MKATAKGYKMQIVKSTLTGEAWGSLYSIEERSLEISSKELIDYLLECGHQDIPDSIDIDMEGDVYEVNCWEVLKGKKKDIVRFYDDSKI